MEKETNQANNSVINDENMLFWVIGILGTAIFILIFFIFLFNFFYTLF